MNVRAVIVEDEPLARRTLRDFMGDVPWLECVGEAEDGRVAVSLIDTEQPDLVFLDVCMPEWSGLDVLERITHQPSVVFTTAYDQYAIDAFEIGAIDYLLKPFGVKRFHDMIKRVESRLRTPHPDPPVYERARDITEQNGWLKRVFVRDDIRIIPLRVDDIVRLEACDDYVSIHAGTAIHLMLVTLSDLEKRLDPEQFIRIHRSHIINLDFIRTIQPYDDRRLVVTLQNDTELIASRSGSQTLRRLIS